MVPDQALPKLACPYCRKLSTTRRRFKNHLFFMHGVMSGGVADFRAEPPPSEQSHARG